MTARVRALGSRSHSARPSASSHSKKSGVAHQPVFDDLAIPGAHLAARQCRQARRVGEHQARLVEGADEVLAGAGVEGGLAADRAVDLRQEGRRDLHEIDAAQQGRRGEPGDVADHPAAQCHQHRAAFDAAGQDIVDQPAEMGEILGPLARRQHDRVLRDAVLGEAGAERRQVMARDILVGDDDGLAPAQQRRHQGAGARDQPGTDQDVIAAFAELDAQLVEGARGRNFRCHCLISESGSEPGSASGGRRARAQPARAAITRFVVTSGEPSPLSTVISASA